MVRRMRRRRRRRRRGMMMKRRMKKSRWMDGIDRYLNDVTKKEHSTRSTYLHLHLLLIPRIAEPKSRHVTSHRPFHA
jgi:hypothetical protein